MDSIEVAGGVFTIGTIAAIVVGWIRGARPKRMWSWERPPVLRFAEGVPTEVRRSTVRALRRVEMLGARVKEYQQGGPSSAARGEIVVTTLEEWADVDHAGRSSTTLSQDRKAALYAIVELPEHGTTDLVAMHELLRCFGFRPLFLSGHVLAWRTSWQGESVDGIAKAFARAV